MGDFSNLVGFNKFLLEKSRLQSDMRQIYTKNVRSHLRSRWVCCLIKEDL